MTDVSSKAMIFVDDVLFTVALIICWLSSFGHYLTMNYLESVLVLQSLLRKREMVDNLVNVKILFSYLHGNVGTSAG